jgi:hypothetical protein
MPPPPDVTCVLGESNPFDQRVPRRSAASGSATPADPAVPRRETARRLALPSAAAAARVHGAVSRRGAAAGRRPPRRASNARPLPLDAEPRTKP